MKTSKSSWQLSHECLQLCRSRFWPIIKGKTIISRAPDSAVQTNHTEKLSATFFSFDFDFFHCGSVAEMVSRYSRSPCRQQPNVDALRPACRKHWSQKIMATECRNYWSVIAIRVSFWIHPTTGIRKSCWRRKSGDSRFHSWCLLQYWAGECHLRCGHCQIVGTWVATQGVGLIAVVLQQQQKSRFSSAHIYMKAHLHET